MENYIFDDFLEHIGVAHDEDPPGRGSGRWGYGTGENPFQHMEGKSLKEQKKILEELHPDWGEGDIATNLGFSSSAKLRAAISREHEERVSARRSEIHDLYSKGMNTKEISRITGVPESTVRGDLRDEKEVRRKWDSEVAEELKTLVNHDKIIDVGIGAEYALGVTETAKKRALDRLRQEGYVTYDLPVRQLTTGFNTTIQVLCPPGTTKDEAKAELLSARPVAQFLVEPDGNRTVRGIPPVNSISSDRLKIVYGDEGGTDRDGLILLREGVPELSLGENLYAQVRIGVDGKSYLKGMAAYSDNMPPGCDIIFNTNKPSGTPLHETSEGAKDGVLKPMEKKIDENGNKVIDQDNPFGTSIKAEEKLTLTKRTYIDENGDVKVSAINIVNESGDWGKWSRNLPSQFLSKQPKSLIKQQLDLTEATMKSDFEDIMSIKNPGVRRVLLDNFADECDKASVDLKAMALPRQQTHVLMPAPELKPGTIYAPNYKEGEEVVLIRFPHAGQFEIPKLTVSNTNPAVKKMLGNAPDAVGIRPETAAQLSGADYDGDTALVIPISGKNKVQYRRAEKDLIEFEPKIKYRAYEGMLRVKDDPRFDTQMQMGMVSNLITDMTLKGAPIKDIVKVVKHSMVVIDAEKHNLDWVRSEKENNIAYYRNRYQKNGGGASTLLSRAKSPVYVDERSARTWIDADGNKIYDHTNRMIPRTKKIVDPETGKVSYENDYSNMRPKKSKSSKMAEAKTDEDVYRLTSGGDRESAHPVEVLYADYAIACKDYARRARLARQEATPIKPSQSAKDTYADEIRSLENKLRDSEMNAPKERMALLRATSNYYKALDGLEDKTDKDAKKKLKNQLMSEARVSVGAKKEKIKITPKEWEAIENYAISTTKTESIIKNVDSKQLMKYALPKEGQAVSDAKQALIKQRSKMGQTIAEIADALNISTSTVQKYASK